MADPHMKSRCREQKEGRRQAGLLRDSLSTGLPPGAIRGRAKKRHWSLRMTSRPEDSWLSFCFSRELAILNIHIYMYSQPLVKIRLLEALELSCL